MNSSDPLVSIVTPSYNRRWIIENCINSVKGQTYKNIEHIVIDACSTDGTLDVLSAARPGYNLKWISEPDQGMYDGINKGLQMAEGDIIAYLNTDDFYFPYTLELVVSAFKAEEGIGMVYGDWVTYYKDSGFIEILPNILVNKYDMARFACLPQPAVFVRKGVFKKVGFIDTSYKLLADNEFFTRAAMSDLKIKKIDEFLAGQVVHNGNLLAGNPAAIITAETDARRYRSLYWDRLRKGAVGMDRLRLVRSMAREKFNSVLWRLRLLEFFLRSCLGLPGKWQRFMPIFETLTISWLDLIRYFASRKRKIAGQYCVSRDFLDTVVSRK